MTKTQTVKKENSAGGCVYKLERKKVMWLLGKHSGYHKWVLPKGLIEEGETAMETAVREVREEMGVAARVVGQKPIAATEYVYEAEYKEQAGERRRVKKYQEGGGKGVRVSKQVTWFLMEWVEGKPEDHDFEMEEAGWFGFEEAIDLLAFTDEKLVLTKARDKILRLKTKD